MSHLRAVAVKSDVTITIANDLLINSWWSILVLKREINSKLTGQATG